MENRIGPGCVCIVETVTHLQRQVEQIVWGGSHCSLRDHSSGENSHWGQRHRDSVLITQCFHIQVNKCLLDISASQVFFIRLTLLQSVSTIWFFVRGDSSNVTRWTVSKNAAHKINNRTHAVEKATFKVNHTVIFSTLPVLLLHSFHTVVLFGRLI